MQRHELVFTDNPRHEILRRLFGEAVNAGEVKALQAKIDDAVQHALAPQLVRGAFDLIADFSFSLPTQVASAWLGIPPEDRGQIVEWIFPIVSGRGISRDPATTAAANRAVDAMNDYLHRLLVRRREHPGNDLTTAFLRVQASAPADLSDADLVGIMLAVFAAGHGPGIAMLANTTLALLRHPDQLAKLQAHPELVPSALEEGLRYDPPSQAPNPVAALADVELGGRTIRSGAIVSVILAAANRDPEAFPAPDRFDIARAPNRHLAFSGGPHYCLGSMLARMEGQSALVAIARSLRNLRLAVPVEALRYLPHDRFRTLESLPIAFDPA